MFKMLFPLYFIFYANFFKCILLSNEQNVLNGLSSLVISDEYLHLSTAQILVNDEHTILACLENQNYFILQDFLGRIVYYSEENKSKINSSKIFRTALNLEIDCDIFSQILEVFPRKYCDSNLIFDAKNLSQVRLLMSHGFNIDSKNAFGQSALEVLEARTGISRVIIADSLNVQHLLLSLEDISNYGL